MDCVRERKANCSRTIISKRPTWRTRYILIGTKMLATFPLDTVFLIISSLKISRGVGGCFASINMFEINFLLQILIKLGKKKLSRGLFPLLGVFSFD